MDTSRKPSSVGPNGEVPGTQIRLLTFDEGYTWLSVGMELAVEYVDHNGIVYVSIGDGNIQGLGQTETWEIIS